MYVWMDIKSLISFSLVARFSCMLYVWILPLDSKLVMFNYRRPTFKCAVKRLRFRVFKEIVNSIIAFWARPHVHNMNSIIANWEKIHIRIYCILVFKCGPTVL